MKIVKEVDVALQARASINEDGTLTAQVIGHSVYHDKGKELKKGDHHGVASTIIEIPEPHRAKIKAALADAIDAVKSPMVESISDAIAVQRQVGKHLKEIKPPVVAAAAS